MKIGICEKDLPLSLEENLKWIVENRFDGFQIWPNKIKNPKEILKFCKNEGIVVSAIGGGPNLVNPKKMNETIEEFKKRIEIAILLETNIITAETKEKPEFLKEESVRDVPLDTGEVDYRKYIKALKDICYKGFLTIEMHSKPDEDRREDILRSKRFLEEIIWR